MDSNEKKEEFIVPPREVISTTTAAIAIAIANENQKSCADCRTTKTPLWRSGPSGPKSLCNACGIRQRKRRAAAAASAAGSSTSTSTSESNKAEEKMVTVDGEKKSKKRGANAKIGKYDELSVEWRQRLMAFGEGVSLFQKDQRSESPSKEKKRKKIEGKKKKMGEVEQAAVLLMSLSCGSVFA